MHKHFYGVASMPKSERSILFIELGEFAKIDESPGPGAYEVSQDRNHNDFPKWRLLIFNAVWRKNFAMGVASKICRIHLPLDHMKFLMRKYCFFNFQKKVSSKRNGFKVEKYRTYAEKKMYPSSPLNIPSSINLKCGHSFGYREQEKVIETSPGPIYNIEDH